MQEIILISKCDEFGIKLPDDFTEKIEKYVVLLREYNPSLSLIAKGEVKNIYQRHIIDSLGVFLFHHIVRDAKVLDYGSGGGLPGIILAIAKPDSGFILAESNKKKAAFIQTCCESLELNNVEIFPDRVEKILQSRGLNKVFDRVTLRAVGPLTKTIPGALKLIKLDGKIALWAGKEIFSKLAYWQRFCLKRSASIEFFPYPFNWMPEYNLGIAIIKPE